MRIITFLTALLSFQTVIAQSVGIGTSTPDPSARLQISSSTQGFLLPTLSAAQRSAINNPATGLLVFQTDGTAGFYYFAGAGWINLATGHAPNNQGTAVSRHFGMTITLAGKGERDTEDGQGAAAGFFFPAGLAVDADGNVYVADSKSNRIRKITPTGLVSTFAGTGSVGSSDVHRSVATFSNPTDVAVDVSGNVYVADQGNNKIRKISTDGQVTTLAGSGTAGFANGPGDIAMFDRPDGLTVDGLGNVYVADEDNHRIRKIEPNGMVSTVAGSSTFGSDDGPAAMATFRSPSDVALDAAGNIYVADQGNHKIRRITPGGDVSTFAGSGDFGEQDGTGTNASFDSPQGVAVDSYGNVYVADRLNDKIRKITPARVVSTLAGTGNIGADDGHRSVVSFANPMRVATDAIGDVYVADHNNHNIRKIIAQ